MLASSLAGIALWTLQWGLEGSCSGAFDARGVGAREPYCPFAFVALAGSELSVWREAGLALTWLTPWLCIPLVIL